MKKRFLALLLSCVLCLGLLPTALAVSNDPVNGPQASAPSKPAPTPDPKPDPTPGRPSGSSSSSSDRDSSRLSVNVPSRTPGGKIKVNPHSADKGETVTITVTPDDGFELDRLIVRDAKGSEVNLKKQGDDTYTFEMPSTKVSIEAAFVRIGTAGPASGFTDVPAGAYYADAVAWAVGRGITNGTTAATFSPNAPCTRAQIVTFLWRAAGSPAAGGANPFGDVAPGAYYYDAVLWAVEQGITGGTTASTFSPNQACTRGQTVTFLYRYEKSPETAGLENPFTDVSADAYYTNAVLWAVKEGVTGGTTASAFSPNATCTRGQIVTFLYRDMA